MILTGVVAHATTLRLTRMAMAIEYARTNRPDSTAVRERFVPDTLRKIKLEIPDSLGALYKYTDALRAATIRDDSTTALRLLREALEIDPDYAPALYRIAVETQRSQPEKALEYARRAYQSDSTNRWYATAYGQSLLINNKGDEALALYRRLMQIDQKNPDHYRIEAIHYQQRQQPYTAISVLDSAEMRFGKNAYLSEMKRSLLISTGQMDRAISEAEQTVEEAPYEQTNHILLGDTYLAAGKDSLAGVTYRRALEMDSTSVQALGAYADYCSGQRDMKGYLATLRLLYAREEFPLERKLELFGRLTSDRKFYGEHYFALGALASTLAVHYPSDKRAIDLYGDHLIAGGDIDAALAHFKLHLKDEPPQMDYYMAVIDMEEYLGRTDSLDHYVQRAMEVFPDDATLQIRKANRQYVRGDMHGAIATFEQALEMVQTDSLRGQIWGYIGDTYNAIKERVEVGDKEDTTGFKMRLSAKKAQKKCFEAYERALALYADNASVLNNYAYFLSVKGLELERAHSMSERAIALESNNATFLDTYAWILYKRGDNERARTYMRQALSLDRTGSAELPLHYGDILFALGEKFMAETYWRKALEQGADAKRIEQRITLGKDAPEGARIEDIVKE